jgi:F-type H+-transporting ATPase subunit gamma
MKKAQERMRASRPLHRAHAGDRTPPGERQSRVPACVSDQAPEVRNVGLIIVTSDKGLCGGLNTSACAWR